MADRPRVRRWRTLLVSGVLLIVAAFAVGALVHSRRTVHTLPDTFEYLPYRFQSASPFDTARLQFRAADLDDDGVDEIITLSKNRRHDERFIGVAFIEESQKYSITQMNMSSACGLMGVLDLTGDGQHELVWSEQRPDGVVEFAITEFDTIAVDSGRHQIGSILWDATGSLMEDGVWGGAGEVISAFDMDGNGTREALLVGMCTGVPLTPRGLWLADWETGRIIATRETAATPQGSVIIDADGDGTDDIVLALESPGNGAVSEPFNDWHSYLAVFEEDLSLMWWRELAGYSSLICHFAADLDGDGTIEIATGVGGHSRKLEDEFGVRIWSAASGESLASIAHGVPVNAITRLSTDAGERICVGLADGRVLRYEYTDGSLIQDAEYRSPEGLRAVRALDFGVSGVEQTILLTTVNGTIVMTDDHLKPLAAWSTEEAIETGIQLTAARFRIGDEIRPGMIFQTGKHLYYTYAERVPLPPWLRRAIDWLRSISSVLLVALATLAVAGAALPRYRRRALGAFRRRLLPRRRREAELDEFLEQLKTGGHGMLSATKTLRRLAGQFTMLSQHEGDTPNAFADRYAEGLANAREIGLPTVQGIADSIRRLGLAPLELPDLTHAVDDVRDVLEEAPTSPPLSGAADSIRSRLERDLERIERGVAVARREAALERSIVLADEIDRVLRARGAQLRRPGLVVRTDGLEGLEETRVLGTPAEFSFVFDNLIENALRAVHERSDARIRLAAAVRGSMMTIDVEDNGVGIAPAEHDRIFAPGVSTREGGGHGLPRSREILDRRGGSLELIRSALGAGAVFRVTLKAVVDDA